MIFCRDLHLGFSTADEMAAEAIPRSADFVSLEGWVFLEERNKSTVSASSEHSWDWDTH
jgi:hypothetical protein